MELCSNCHGSGMDVTYHFGDQPGEPHPCGYCRGGVYGPVSWLDWEPEQRTFLAHVVWRWTGALFQDIVRFLARREKDHA